MPLLIFYMSPQEHKHAENQCKCITYLEYLHLRISNLPQSDLLNSIRAEEDQKFQIPPLVKVRNLAMKEAKVHIKINLEKLIVIMKKLIMQMPMSSPDLS